MKAVLFAVLALSPAALADTFLADLTTKKCTAVKKEWVEYRAAAMGDPKLEVVYEDFGLCGESMYIMKKKGRKRWAAFPKKQGCQCYLDKSKSLEKAK